MGMAWFKYGSGVRIAMRSTIDVLRARGKFLGLAQIGQQRLDLAASANHDPALHGVAAEPDSLHGNPHRLFYRAGRGHHWADAQSAAGESETFRGSPNPTPSAQELPPRMATAN